MNEVVAALVDQSARLRRYSPRRRFILDSMIVRVVLEGGVPWGFRVDTDGRRHAPRICKVSNEDTLER